MIFIRNEDGEIVRRSKNLRGIIDKARSEGVERVVLDVVRGTGQAYIAVFFGDNCTATANFADWRVMRAWVKARRSWAGCEVLDLLG